MVDDIKNHVLKLRLVSFVVEVLLPSIPVDNPIKSLEKWLNYIGIPKAEGEINRNMSNKLISLRKINFKIKKRS